MFLFTSEKETFPLNISPIAKYVPPKGFDYIIWYF